jgi:ribulose-5-phosphate 4-epimerase/fuculose-1-phosphate aldolase
MTSFEPAAAYGVEKGLLEDLVTANHILYAQHVVDGFGHVSLRHPSNPQAFLIATSIAPALVQQADLIMLDLAGAPTDATDKRPIYLERFIHSEIYRARPDVQSIVHSHSPAVIPFSVVKATRLRPICHLCAFLGPDVPNFDIRSQGDGSDMLIRSTALGAALAHSLGQSTAVLMRGHGSTVVGEHVRQAVFRAIYLQLNAALQAEALRLGEVTFLSDAEIAAGARMIDQGINRAWDLWVRDLG